MAAAANHPEGLYNLGVLHNNGMAGLPVNRQAALDYFFRAAKHINPFPMALNALGGFYLYGDHLVITVIRTVWYNLFYLPRYLEM